MRVAAVALVLLLGGCRHAAVRELNAREQRYFEALSAELRRAEPTFQEIAAGNRVNEERAVREVALQDVRVEAARLVYSVRELLTAPRRDRAAFVQETRNKVVLLHLASLADFEEARVGAELAAGDERRAKLEALRKGLLDRVRDVIATDRALHAYLDRRDVEGVADLAREVGRQLDAFRGELAQADRANPVVAAADRGAVPAADVAAKASRSIDELVQLWTRLDRGNKD